MLSWRHHLCYWGASVLSVLAYHVSVWMDAKDKEVLQFIFRLLLINCFMLYFVLQSHGLLQSAHYLIFAAAYILGLVALPHSYIVMLSRVALAILPVCTLYRVSLGPVMYRRYSEPRYWMTTATLMISLGALPHPFTAPVADPWLIDGAVHALFSFMVLGAVESTRQNVSLYALPCS
jgi:uncharacterized Tic20 family protein